MCITSGAFFWCFSSRCIWHQEHHTQQQETTRSLHREPCKTYHRSIFSKLFTDCWNMFHVVIPWSRICCAWKTLWRRLPVGQSKVCHKHSAYFDRSNHIRVDSRTLQICLKLSKRGRGHTRNHSNLENTHSFKILKRVLNINYLSQFHTYRWLHPQSNHTVQCSIQPGRFEPFDSKIRPKRFLCGNSIHPFICHLFVEIFFFQFSNFPSISDRKNVNLPPDSFNSCFSTSR